MKTEIKVGKKLTIRIPKGIAEELNIHEGDRLLLIAKEDKIILKVIRDPIWLAINGKKFAKISLDEIEKISEEEQKEYESTN
ncbi:hypothetical protein SJAV_16760 [Sulfurisphaera javensis]|uniref:SpoVT-AbrB domain-containing protein n=1 Tax=Sulfurisphaera javensis TaxID=2049879 RepID=A0AAT9GSY1_9CREN